MMRFAPAAPIARAHALLGVSAAIALALAASGCASGSQPAPTPDPFNGLAERSDQAYREGLEAYGEGKYRDALTAFDRARLLSPSGDARIDQMLERTRAAMAPTATPPPPAPTSVATPTPVAPSTLVPDADLGARYFGQVMLTVVPGREATPRPSSQFFFQDQLGLRIEGLKQYFRLPFMLRVFDAESSRLVAQVGSEAAANGSPEPTPVPVRTASARAAANPASPGASPSPSAAGDEAIRLTRFWDDYVWYHEGGEKPGRYRAELYANGTLTHVFEYTVGTLPVAAAEEPTAPPALDPSPTLPLATPEPATAPVGEVRPRTPPV
ncbi:MAG: hypothetical protein M3336_01645, partial [Chloroflexota bacterium]|nr:hypothetical protein [Chloroflexota bacterium]